MNVRGLKIQYIGRYTPQNFNLVYTQVDMLYAMQIKQCLYKLYIRN